jgi:hypothetical protein
MQRRPANQSFNALLNGRVRRKQARESLSRKQRRNNKQVRRVWRGHEWNLAADARNLFESAGQRIRIAGQLGTRGVCLVLARAGDPQLNEHGREGSQQKHENRTKAAAFAVAPVAAHAPNRTEPERHACQDGNRSGQCGGDGAGEDVTVAHVAQFVSQHAF